MYFKASWSHAQLGISGRLIVWLLEWKRTRSERTPRQMLVLGVITGLDASKRLLSRNLLVVHPCSCWTALRHTNGELGTSIIFRGYRKSAKPWEFFRMLSRQVLFGKYVVLFVVFFASCIPSFRAGRVTAAPVLTKWISLDPRFPIGASPSSARCFFRQFHGCFHGPRPDFSLVSACCCLARRSPLTGGPVLAGRPGFYFFISSYPDGRGDLFLKSIFIFPHFAFPLIRAGSLPGKVVPPGGVLSPTGPRLLVLLWSCSSRLASRFGIWAWILSVGHPPPDFPRPRGPISFFTSGPLSKPVSRCSRRFRVAPAIPILFAGGDMHDAARSSGKKKKI